MVFLLCMLSFNKFKFNKCWKDVEIQCWVHYVVIDKAAYNF